MLAGLASTQLAPLVWALVLVLLAIFVTQAWAPPLQLPTSCKALACSGRTWHVPGAPRLLEYVCLK